MSVVHTLQLVFGILGNAATLFLFLVPAITFKRIIKNKSTEQFSGIPYVMTFLNCLLSAWYGLPFVTQNNVLLATVNGGGAAIELIYVLIFLMYAPSKEKGKMSAIFFIVVLAFGGMALVSMLSFHGRDRKLFCGTAAAIFSVVMYASPMSIIRLVIKTKSVEYMPFFLSFSVVVSCSCWFTYAMLGKDPFIGVATGGGLVLGMVQLVLYGIYSDKGTKNSESTMEIGNIKNVKSVEQWSFHEQSKQGQNFKGNQNS